MSRHSCGLSEEQVTAFAQGELEPREATRLARHIMICPECSELLGRLQAADTLLNLPTTDKYPDSPSAEFWSRLSARLDDVDEVAEATPAVCTPFQRFSRAGLALTGLTVAALIISSLALARLLPLPARSGSTVALAELLAIHQQALTGSAPGHFSVGLSSSAHGAAPVWPYTVQELNGAPAVGFTYSLGNRRATTILLARGSLDLRRLQPLQGPDSDRRFWTGSLADGSSLLVDTGGPLWQVVISDAPPQQMLWLLTHRPGHVSSSAMPSM